MKPVSWRICQRRTKSQRLVCKGPERWPPVQVEFHVNVLCDVGTLTVAVSSDWTPSFKGLLIISSKAVKSFQMNIIRVEKREGGITWLGHRRFLVPSSLTYNYTLLFPWVVETQRLLYGNLQNREIATCDIISHSDNRWLEYKYSIPVILLEA